MLNVGLLIREWQRGKDLHQHRKWSTGMLLFYYMFYMGVHVYWHMSMIPCGSWTWAFKKLSVRARCRFLSLTHICWADILINWFIYYCAITHSFFVHTVLSMGGLITLWQMITVNGSDYLPTDRPLTCK